MLTTKINAFNKIGFLVKTSLQKINGLTKPHIKFMNAIFELWLILPVRYTMLNLSRFGCYSDKSIRLHFEQHFDFAAFNMNVIEKSCGKHLVAAFDPSYIPKSGKTTPGLGRYWSGKDQCALKGLEIGCLAIIDVDANTAMPLEIVQTPSKEILQKENKNLVAFYVSIIENQMSKLKSKVKYLAIDGYFMKKDFINSMLELLLDVITKARPDANLRYPAIGPKKKGRGRPKLYGDKVDCKNIDKRRIKKFDEDEDAIYYSGIVYSITLKRLIRIVYLMIKESNRHEIFLSTDINLEPSLILQYYRLRFQIEFLIRDAKQHAGLEECQARSENKLHFHFNMAYSTIGVAKAATWLSIPKEERESFSMRNLKLLYYNKFLTERIFSNLGIDISCKKIKRLYRECLEIGNLAA